MEIHDLVILNMPDNDFTLNTKELIGAYLFLLNNDLIAKKVFFALNLILIAILLILWLLRNI